MVHDFIDQLIEIEDGGDLLRCFLQLEQILDLLQFKLGPK